MIAWIPAVTLAFSPVCLGTGGTEVGSGHAADVDAELPRPGGPDNPKAFRVEIWTLCFDYFLLTELRFSMLVVLLVGPSLISRDLRFNALPLYFSGPSAGSITSSASSASW